MVQQGVVAALVTGFVFISLFSSAGAEEPALSLEQRLDRLVQDYYPVATETGAREPGTAVLVMVEGKPVLRQGYGMANREKGVRLTPDMIFRIASITKQFTAVAVLQLVQQGAVALDDPITQYFPDVDTRGKTITVEHLLTHTAGLPNYTEGQAYFDGMTRDMAPAEIVELVAGKPLHFDPGTQFRYSNTNYVLLGMLMEKVTGRTYAEHLASAIANPLGLADTRYSRDDGLTPRHARGYEREGSGPWEPARPLSMTQPYAAGAIESTVDDLAKWTLAVAAGKAVDLKLLERAWTPYKPSEGSSDYGYGWSIRTEAGERWIGHNGGINGYQSAAVFIPEKKVYVAILRNGMGGPAPDVLLRRLALEAVGRPERERVAITLPVGTLERYRGIYALSPDTKFTVLRRGEKLFAEAPNGSQVELYAEAEDKFFSSENDMQFSFTMQGGKPTQMTIRRGGRDHVAKRVE